MTDAKRIAALQAQVKALWGVIVILRRDSRLRHTRHHSTKPNDRSRIYFAQAAHGGLIKIGHSIDVARRLRELERDEMTPLRVLATTKGGYWDEQRLHSRFAKYRARGEWFKPVPELLAHIAALNGAKQSP